MRNRKIRNRYDKFPVKFYIKAQNAFLKLSKKKKNYIILDSSENTPHLQKNLTNCKKKIKSSMTSKKLYGLKKYFQNLINIFETSKLPKVLMFSGEKGQGKMTLTHHFVSYCF